MLRWLTGKRQPGRSAYPSNTELLVALRVLQAWLKPSQQIRVIRDYWVLGDATMVIGSPPPSAPRNRNQAAPSSREATETSEATRRG